MRKKSADAETENQNFQSTNIHHLKVTKILIIVLAIFLLACAGFFFGIIGGTLSSLIVVANQESENILLLLCIILSLVIWIAETIKFGFLSGLLKASFASFILIFTLKVVLQNLSSINTFFLLILIYLIVSFLGFITASISLFIPLLIIAKKQQIIKQISYNLIGFVSAIVSVFIGVFPSEKTTLTETNFTVIKLVVGFVVGLTMAASAYNVSNFETNPNKNYIFLKNWAINLCTWGNTSFHNLDLSNANFRGVNLANIDLRAKKFYRTCFLDATGLDRARVDNRYLDLEIPKVQKLLTHGDSEDKDFSEWKLRGAYLQNADLRDFNLTDSELTGANLEGADLRGSILVRTQLINVDFTNARLTGACIKDWSVNSQTEFTEIECDYVYREIDEAGNPTDRFPHNRNFEPREFESLYQEVDNVVELIFREGENWQAAFFSLKKIQLEDEDLELEIKGIEKRGDLFVVKVIHSDNYSKQEVEQRLGEAYEEMRKQLAAKETQINQLIGIVDTQAKTLESLSKQPFGNNFFISGSTITNLAGSGQIDYDEAANQVRNLVASSTDTEQANNIANNLLQLLQDQRVATTEAQQTELLEQVILQEATTNNLFRQFLLQQEEQITHSLPTQVVILAMQNALKKLKG